MVSTIKVQESTKNKLNDVKFKNESYDDLINRFITPIDKDNIKKKLKEKYSSMTKEEIEEFKEWEAIDL